jgi:glycosyltransferase involved in cell wall biosynthesis
MRILILGPWCIERPLHGGQIRARQIVQAYRAAGHEVGFSGLYNPKQTDPADHTEADHPVTPAILQHILRIPGTPNMGFWRALAEEPASFARFCDRINSFRPDVIQFEEPFFWPLLRRLVEAGALERKGGARIRILHSSYNIEHAWRREYREGATLQEDAFLLELEALEHDIARRADAICTVSASDAAAFEVMGADRVVVAPNGTALPTPAPAALRCVRQYLDRQPFALFVSSAHPPNASGFMHMIRGAAGARLRNGIVVVCGDVARLLNVYAREPGLQYMFRNIRLLGQVPGDFLAALYVRAQVVVVPRTLGGGSNLKTAEALLSGRPIVATRRAFIGFEEHVTAPGVHLVDDPTLFWPAIDTLLAEAPAAPILRKGVESLAWSHTLAPMVRAAEALV